MKIRIQKLIADAGLSSRRQAEIWLSEGRVKVNGKKIDKLGSTADPEVDVIEVNGKQLPKKQEKTYILFNKPGNCLTTAAKDERGRQTVMDFFKKVPGRVFPVGRLDFNTQGVLLMTNDGALSEKLLEPRFKIERVYLAKVRGVPDEKKLNRLRKGLWLDSRPTAPLEVEMQRASGKNCFLKFKLTEGKNRHIKRICEMVGHPVIRLKRVSFAGIGLGDLPLGAFRFLGSREIRSLKNLISAKEK